MGAAGDKLREESPEFEPMLEEETLKGQTIVTTIEQPEQPEPTAR